MMYEQDTILERTDPAWLDVQAHPIVECGESLIDAREAGDQTVVSPAYRHDGFANALPVCYLRETVLARLCDAAEALPTNRRLVVLDGWRPFALQTALYDDFSRRISARFPDLDVRRHREQVHQFVAPPSQDPQAPSPHLTGGAVDVMLCDVSGGFLDMGTAFDEPSLVSRTAALESAGQPIRMHSARHNRRQLFAAMTAAGFSNLASEWWHFDHGDQLWAWSTNQPEAIYGKASPC